MALQGIFDKIAATKSLVYIILNHLMRGQGLWTTLISVPQIMIIDLFRRWALQKDEPIWSSRFKKSTPVFRIWIQWSGSTSPWPWPWLQTSNKYPRVHSSRNQRWKPPTIPVRPDPLKRVQIFLSSKAQISALACLGLLYRFALLTRKSRQVFCADLRFWGQENVDTLEKI